MASYVLSHMKKWSLYKSSTFLRFLCPFQHFYSPYFFHSFTVYIYLTPTISTALGDDLGTTTDLEESQLMEGGS